LVTDPRDGHVLRTVAGPARPTGVVISPDGSTLCVTGGGAAGVARFLRADSGAVLASVPVGHTPGGPSITPDGKRVYVCNRFSGNVSVIDVNSKKQVAIVAAQREPVASAVTPDGKQVLVANHLPSGPADRSDVSGVVTVIKTAGHTTSAIRLPSGSTSLRGLCVSPDGKYALVVHVLGRFQVPTTQLERGWINVNALSVIDIGAGRLAGTVLLDEEDSGAANSWGVASTPDGRWICVSHAGTHELSVIDLPALIGKLATFARDQHARPDLYRSVVSPSNDHGFLVGLRRRIDLRQGPAGQGQAAAAQRANGPRGVTVLGSKAYVTLYFSDQLGHVDLEDSTRDAVTLVPLGPPPQVAPERLGQMHFHDATLCFQQWQSCASCHPDGRADGLNWDLLNDGVGNPGNAKSLLLAHATPPSMSSGVRQDAPSAVRSGFRHILFAPQADEVTAAVDAYLKSLSPVPSPFLVEGQLSDAARRGRELFLDPRFDCARCHSGSLYTDLKKHDVGSRAVFDRRATFDTPTLIECWRTAPYLHDGRYATLLELFRVGRHGLMGVAENLTEQETKDLVEFVRSL
jgi:YVTN family beta-propeller protein